MNKKIAYGTALVLLLVAPQLMYPVFLMKVLCFALFACAFNLLIGFTGLLSFGHAAFLVQLVMYQVWFCVMRVGRSRPVSLLALWSLRRLVL